MKNTFDLANKIGWLQVILIALKVADISVLNWKQTFIPFLILMFMFVVLSVYMMANIEYIKKKALERKNQEDETERLNQLDEIFKNDGV